MRNRTGKSARFFASLRVLCDVRDLRDHAKHTRKWLNYGTFAAFKPLHTYLPASMQVSALTTSSHASSFIFHYDTQYRLLNFRPIIHYNGVGDDFVKYQYFGFIKTIIILLM